MLPRLAGVEIPAYLGRDWENVPLHLPSTFAVWKALAGNPSVRVGLLGAHGSPGRGRASISRRWRGSTTG
jgi:hypothetical protein